MVDKPNSMGYTWFNNQTRKTENGCYTKPGKPNPQNAHCVTRAADVPATKHADGQQVLPLFNVKREPQCRKDGTEYGRN